MRIRVKAADRIGERFGRLIILRVVGRYRTTAIFECLCDCGTLSRVTCSALVSGNTKSCGCLHSERVSEAASRTFKKHGKSDSAIFKRWCGMIERCSNPNHRYYRDYGGRGITVCDRWRSFENFYSDMGDPPSKSHSIDRLDVNREYSPENCRWATSHEQTRNQRTNVFLTYKGKTQILSDWSLELGIGKATIRKRLRMGWSDEQTLATPPRRNSHVSNK